MNFTEAEIDNLKRLLASHELDSFSLGLTMIEENIALRNADILPIIVWKKLYWNSLFEDLSYNDEQGEEEKCFDRLSDLYSQIGDATKRHVLENALDLFFNWPGSFWGDLDWEAEREGLQPKLDAYTPYRAVTEAYLLNNRNFVNQYVDLGYSLLKMKQFQTAFGFLKPATESGLCSMPGKIHYINCLVVGMLSKDSPYISEVPNIIRFLGDAIQAYPTYKNQYYTQMAMLSQVYLNNIEQALEYNYMSHEIDDNYPVNLNNLAWLQYKYEGKYEEAYQNISKAIELSKDEPKASYLNTLACLEMDYKENIARAEELFLEALNDNPNHHHTLLRLGDINNSKNNLEEALKYYEKSIAINDLEHDKKVESLWKLADFYHQKIKNTQKALTYCEALLDIAPQHEQAIDLKQFLVN